MLSVVVSIGRYGGSQGRGSRGGHDSTSWVSLRWVVVVVVVEVVGVEVVVVEVVGVEIMALVRLPVIVVMEAWKKKTGEKRKHSFQKRVF